MSRSPKICRVCGVRLPQVAPELCDVCGFEYLGVGAARYDYDAEYDEKSDYNKLPAEQILEHYRRAPNTAWALEVLSGLKTQGASSLFEFGASQGAFLALAREAGFQARGVELASASIEYGRQKLALGATLEQGVWRARRPDEPQVDVVCAFEVLEHSEDPIDFLLMMKSWLRPGGSVLLSVPNAQRLSVRLGRRESQDFPPHHLMYWTPRALELAVRRVALFPVEVKTSQLTHSDLLNLVLPGLAAQRAVDSGAFRPVGAVTAKRGLPSMVKLPYPLFVAAGRLVAKSLNALPSLGQRLMLHARLMEN